MKGEESSLAAALEAVFSRRENADQQQSRSAAREEGERRSRSRNRSRTRRPEGEGQKPVPKAAFEQDKWEEGGRPERRRPSGSRPGQKPGAKPGPKPAPKGGQPAPAAPGNQEGGDKKPNRRRRHRPKGNGNGGAKPNGAPQG